MTEQPSEQEFVTRASSGDHDALAKLCEMYTPLVYALCSKLGAGRHHADIEDLVAEVWMKVFTHIKEFDPSRGSFRPWLLTVARHTAISMIRRNTRLREKDLESQDELLN